MNPNVLTIIMVVVFLCCGLGVFLLGYWMLRKGPLSKNTQRISSFVAATEADGAPSSVKNVKPQQSLDLTKFRDWINDSLGSLSSEKLKIKLSSVYWEITDTEFILIRFFGIGAAFFLGWLIPGSILAGLSLAIVANMAPRFLLDRAVVNRQKKFQNQLIDVLQLIHGAVQAGYSLMQALDLAVDEIPAPASEEFGRVLREMRLGITLEGALYNLSQRMENDDLHIVVTAIIINSQVGGNLSTVLAASISTIRGRQQLMGEIKSLTSYARYVGYFLTAMPFLAGFLIFMVSPDYFDTVRTSIITQFIFGSAFVGIIIGNIWIRKIVQIKV